MAREGKDVSSLDSGVPLLFMKTKQKERRTRGEREKKMHEGAEERREGLREGAGERKVKASH